MNKLSSFDSRVIVNNRSAVQRILSPLWLLFTYKSLCLFFFLNCLHIHYFKSILSCIIMSVVSHAN